MGYLPIILAILGFAFLWGIVNYHSIKTRNREVTDASDLVYRYAALRQNIIIQLANIDSEDDSLRTFLHRVRQAILPIDKDNNTVSELLVTEKELSQHIDDLPDQLGKLKNYRSSIEQLQKADLAYRVAANRYTLKMQQYNDLVTKAPSKFLAAIAGFKPIRTVTPQEDAVAVS
ncbi:MAG: hypothetical protein AAF992_16365 [Bacteroidota bacterium]